MQAQLEAVRQAQRDTQRGATHEEARAENDKDTRALESTYLARGLAERVVTLEHAVASLSALKPRVFGPEDPAALGALVSVRDEESGRCTQYLLVAAGGGHNLEFEGETIQSITTASPLGSALIGKYVDEDVELRTPKGRRELSIADIR